MQDIGDNIVLVAYLLVDERHIVALNVHDVFLGTLPAMGGGGKEVVLIEGIVEREG